MEFIINSPLNSNWNLGLKKCSICNKEFKIEKIKTYKCNKCSVVFDVCNNCKPKCFICKGENLELDDSSEFILE
jgi:Zn finger protein HypA/HybF involved in hydrogenase expression